MVNEKEEKLARIKEWRRKKQEMIRLRNLKYIEKNRKKRAEFPRACEDQRVEEEKAGND